MKIEEEKGMRKVPIEGAMRNGRDREEGGAG